MFEPNNEMGVVVRFAQVCESYGYEIVSIQSAYPDAVIRGFDKEWRVEFEYLASNFLAHRHDPRKCDLIVCWVNDLRDNELPLTIWELSSAADFCLILEVPEAAKELAYYRAENKYLRRQLDQRSARSSDGEVAERIIAFVYDIETREGRTPSSREVAAAIGCANSYAFTVMKDMRDVEPSEV